MSKSIRPLGNLAVLFAGWIIFCSSVMFYCEQGVWNEEKGYYERTTFFGEKERSPFRSIPDTCYWMVVTMTTVGYGDLFPTTLPGRLVGSLIVFVSIICLAVPISMVGVNIDQASSEYIKRAKGEEDTLADRNEIPEVDLSDQTIEYAEDLYALLRSAHKSLEDIADAIEPHLNPKKHNLKGIPPTSILLLERSFRVVKASFRRSELMTHKLINNELYGMMTLKHSVAARPLIRNKLFTNRIVMARTAFLGWRTWTRENREKRAQGMNTNFTSPKLPEEVETKSVSPSNKTSPVPKTLEAELGETKLSSSYMNGISRPNTSLRRSTEPGILSSPSAKEKKQNRDRFIGSVSMPPGTVATVNSGETVASTEKAGTP
uniref:Ion transport domain-containing protein n=1 Tax=Amorphochlora amoebiformis TaxID=1561963 RepID=A0A7S0H815_9EUKA